MKNKHQILVITFFCLLLTACGPRYTNNSTILKAESLLNEHPDSAYKLLSSIANPQHLAKSDYAAWCLHYTHARYKLYMNISSDSLIKVAVDYYADSKLRKQSGTAYYLLGCVSELLQRKGQAMLAYKQAVEKLEDTNENNIVGLATINMGYIYEQDKNYYEATPCFRKSLEIFNRSGNKRYQLSSNLEISNMLLRLDYPFDSVLYYSNKALKLAKEINNTVFTHDIISQQGELFYKKNRKTAIKYLSVGFNHCPYLRTRNAAYLAYIYTELKNPDSATYYLKIANEKKEEREFEILKCIAGAAVYENRKDFRQAYYSMEDAYINQDTIFREKLKSQLYRIDKQFDLTEKEKENADLKIANRTKIIWISALTILVLMTLVVLQRVNAIHKKKQTELEKEQQRLAFELREKELENQTKRQLLISKLQQKIEITLRFKKLQQGAITPKKREEFIEQLTNQIILAENEWQYYIDETNMLFNNRITNLQESYKELTAADSIVVVLISLGITIADCCNLLSSTKETMYTRRKRIKKRLEIDADIELEDWLGDYLSKPA
jgi:hypothetical protein